MVFWLWVGITVAIILAFLIVNGRSRYNDWTDGIFGAIMTVVVSGILFGVFMTIFYFNSRSNMETDHTSKLKALTLGSSVEGHVSGSIFATYGEVDGKRVINYLSEGKNGAIYVKQADAYGTTIYQDATDGTATVKSEKNFYRNGWILPWDMYGYYPSHIFHVPKGSVSSDITVDNSK
jgi:hypothetical protein